MKQLHQQLLPQQMQDGDAKRPPLSQADGMDQTARQPVDRPLEQEPGAAVQGQGQQGLGQQLQTPFARSMSPALNGTAPGSQGGVMASKAGSVAGSEATSDTDASGTPQVCRTAHQLATFLHCIVRMQLFFSLG